MTTAVVAGVDVGGTNVRALGLDADGSIVARAADVTPADDLEAALDRIAAVATEVAPGGPVGVGVPGLVDLDGVLRSGANVTWRDAPIARVLTERMGRPVHLENDCTAGAFAEWQVGAAQGVGDVLYVGVGTGIGGGLVVGGRLARGAHGAAGEIGHIVVEPGGEVCGCGNRGCWETVASGTAITREGRIALTRHAHSALAAMTRDPEEVTGEMVTEAARAGDPAARGILAEVGMRLGAGIAGLVNVLDPAVVVVGGGVTEAGDLLLAPARHSYERTAQRQPPAPITTAALGIDAAAIGAALLALEAAA